MPMTTECERNAELCLKLANETQGNLCENRVA
jgi:hypothetical protein